MLENDTKTEIAEIQAGVTKTIADEKSKISTELLKSPTVITIAVCMLLAIGNTPLLLFVIGTIFAVVVLFKSAPPKALGSVALKIPRDIIKNRQKIKEKAIEQASNLKDSLKKNE